MNQDVKHRSLRNKVYIVDIVYIMYYDVSCGGDRFDSSHECDGCPQGLEYGRG